MLVLIGATPEGKKELIGFQVGVRESAQSWRELLVEVKSRGLTIAPEIAVGDGALGFWKALDEVFPGTRHQRCWVHKTANVLKGSVREMKKDLREIYLAPNRASAEVAINVFAEKYGAKYDKAVECLTKDREALLALYERNRKAPQGHSNMQGATMTTATRYAGLASLLALFTATQSFAQSRTTMPDGYPSHYCLPTTVDSSDEQKVYCEGWRGFRRSW